MAEHSVQCPVCGGTVTADTEDKLVATAQQHMKDKHGRTISKQEAQDLVKQKAAR